MPRHCLSRTNTLTLSARRRRLLMHQKRRVTRLAQQVRRWPWLRRRHAAARQTAPSGSAACHVRTACRSILEAAGARVAAHFPFLRRWWRHVRLRKPHHTDLRYPRDESFRVVRGFLCWCWLSYASIAIGNMYQLLDNLGFDSAMHHPVKIVQALLTHHITTMLMRRQVAGELWLAGGGLAILIIAWAILDTRCERKVLALRAREEEQIRRLKEQFHERRFNDLYRRLGDDPPPADGS